MKINLTIAAVRELATSRGGRVISKRIVSAQTLLAFVCPACQGEFQQRWATYRRNPTGQCPACNQPRGERNGSFKNMSSAERMARDPQTRLASHRRFEIAVFARDNQQCVLTGATTDLVAHHLNNWAEFPAQRESVGNGITLTRTLHDQFHRQYGHTATREQFTHFYMEYLRHA